MNALRTSSCSACRDVRPPGYPPAVTATTWDAPDENSDMKFAAWVQAPVATVNGPLVVSSFTQPSHGSFDCDPLDTTLDGVNPDGSYCYTPDPNYSGRDSFFYVVSDVDGKQRGSSVTLTVAPQNDPPVLAAVGPSVTSDDDSVLTVPLTALINGGLGTETNADEDPNDGLCTYTRGHAMFQCGTTTISDEDPSDPLGGIAVTGLTGPGVWSFSRDGTVFVDFGTVSPSNALLLPPPPMSAFTVDRRGRHGNVHVCRLGPVHGDCGEQGARHLPAMRGRGRCGPGDGLMFRWQAPRRAHLRGVQSGRKSAAGDGYVDSDAGRPERRSGARRHGAANGIDRRGYGRRSHDRRFREAGFRSGRQQPVTRDCVDRRHGTGAVGLFPERD